MSELLRRFWRPVKQTLLELARVWLTVVGLTFITVGVCLFLFPLGLMCGGACALLLEWRIDAERRGGGR